jgi:DsbC/DsbD-like thiol-disulfide interchange protein
MIVRKFSRTIALLCASSAIVTLPAQQFNMDAPAKPKAYVLYDAEAQTVPAGRPATLELRFQVVPGYHVNSHTPKSQLLIPTVVTLQPAPGVKTAALEYPAGKSYSFSFDPGNKLDIYADSFTVKLPVIAAPGQHTIDGSLRYQACDNAACYPPRILPVKVLFNAK